MRSRVQYIADDGQSFETIEECARHEGGAQLARIMDEAMKGKTGTPYQGLPASVREKLVAALLDNAPEVHRLLSPLVPAPDMED